MISSRLSIKDSRFHIVSQDKTETLEQTSLDVVIVGANPGLAKQYYEGEFSADRESYTPDCYSLDGITPNKNSALIQSDVCALCSQNSWGSRVTPQGFKVKACSDIKRLAITFADKPKEIYLLQVTPSSLKSLNAYQKTLSMRGIAPEISKTTLSFDTEVTFPKLKFKFGGLVSKDAQSYVDSIIDADVVKMVTGELAVTNKPTTPAEEYGFTEEVGYTINNKSED